MTPPTDIERHVTPPIPPPCPEPEPLAAILDAQTLLERDLPGPNCEVFRAHQYHFAVDGNLDTQWVSTWTNASVGDYFGKTPPTDIERRVTPQSACASLAGPGISLR